MCIVVEKLLRELLESRDLLVESIEVLEEEIITFKFSSIVLVNLLSELDFLLLDSQMDFLE